VRSRQVTGTGPIQGGAKVLYKRSFPGGLGLKNSKQRAIKGKTVVSFGRRESREVVLEFIE